MKLAGLVRNFVVVVVVSLFLFFFAFCVHSADVVDVVDVVGGVVVVECAVPATKFNPVYVL